MKFASSFLIWQLTNFNKLLYCSFLSLTNNLPYFSFRISAINCLKKKLQLKNINEFNLLKTQQLYTAKKTIVCQSISLVDMVKFLLHDNLTKELPSIHNTFLGVCFHWCRLLHKVQIPDLLATLLQSKHFFQHFSN